MGDILNNRTHAELTAIREQALTRARQDRACIWCGKVLNMRPDQKFCCAAHRTAFHVAASALAQERLTREKALWEVERAALVLEVADLRHRLDALRAGNT